MTIRTLAEVWIPGRPRTKGSLNDHGNGGMSDSPASKRWRAHMVDSVRMSFRVIGHAEAGTVPSVRPIRVEALCFMPAATAESMEDDEEIFAATSPKRTSGNGDLDKLARNLLDALARDLHDDTKKGADLFADDVRVIDLPVRKVLEGPLGPGILVRVTELDATEVARMQALALAALSIVTAGGQWETGYLT